MKIQTQEDSSGLIINDASQKRESKDQASKGQNEKEDMSTPQFPYTKWEVYFIYIFYLMAFIFVIRELHHYMILNFDEIRPILARSYISDILQSAIGNPLPGSGTQNNQNLQPLLVFKGFKINIYRYNQDPQWQAYRSNLWLLILTAIFWKFLTYCIHLCDKFILGRNIPTDQKKNIFSYTNSYIFVFSCMVMLFSFRADIVFYLSIIVLWWLYVEALITIRNKIKHIGSMSISKKRFNDISIFSFWIIMLITLYLNQITNHFRSFSTEFQKLIPQILSPLKNSYRAIHCSQFLNMTFLRLLSYGIDRIHEGDQEWQKRQNELKLKRMIPCEECEIKEGIVAYCYKGRDHIVKRSHSLREYLNYTLFTPLLLTGPPISYNNFYSFKTLPAPQTTLKQLLYHAFLILSFQIYQHIFPVVALTPHMTLLQMEVFSLSHLVFIWYKFLIIWRTAKIWANLYGVHVINNMSRCIFNNYGFEGFWRMWHRGFNQWLIRYLYVPLGGKDNIISILAVVSFVAFWHDHTINIIFWGLIIALFMVPEIMIKRYFRKNKKHLYKTYWFKYVAGFVSSIYIHFLVICNCIGFGYGMGKMELMLEKITTEYTTIILSVLVVTFPTLCMFHKRNLENNDKNF